MPDQPNPAETRVMLNGAATSVLKSIVVRAVIAQVVVSAFLIGGVGLLVWRNQAVIENRVTAGEKRLERVEDKLDYVLYGRRTARPSDDEGS